jgi:hypothetical protein
VAQHSIATCDLAVRFEMKYFVLLILAPVFFSCSSTPNVNRRKAGQPWNYYGDLGSVYHDQTRGAKAELVWLDQVVFLRVEQSAFQKSVQNLLKVGYRKIGMIVVRSAYFVDPYEIKKLAADKGANMVVGCWFAGYETRTGFWSYKYWYQLLDKPIPANKPVVPQAPVSAPTPPNRPSPLY